MLLHEEEMLLEEEERLLEEEEMLLEEGACDKRYRLSREQSKNI